MKSKGFKIIVGVLAVVIIVLGGLLVLKTMGASGGATSAIQGGKEIPEGVVIDDASLPLPPEGAAGEIATPTAEGNSEA